MDVCLLYREKDSTGDYGYEFKNDIVKDLRLDIVFREMARGDSYLASVARNVMLKPLQTTQDLQFRQEILSDCINNPKAFIDLYQEALETKKDVERIRIEETKLNRQGSQAMKIYQSLENLKVIVKHIDQLKALINMYEASYTSPGMIKFCAAFEKKYSVEAVVSIKKAMEEMKFLTEGGMISISGNIGSGMKCTNLMVNHMEKRQEKKISFLKAKYYNFLKPEIVLLNNQDIIQNARKLEEAGLYHILKIYDGFIKEMMEFFDSFRYQIAFYIGCLNLYNRTEQYHVHISMPKLTGEKDTFKFQGLYDMVLALDLREKPICNDIDVSRKDLLVITGANQGGKSTFLRSIGIAQVMMQAGMFVPASNYMSDLFDGIFTHFSRREDAAMNSGKLEEELIRMNHIIDATKKNTLILLNEPFATTTEKEGSLIAYDIVRALYEANIKTFLVTHLYAFSKKMFDLHLENAYFLGAERKNDGTRTYKMVEHEPKETSYGIDLYENILGISCDYMEET